MSITKTKILHVDDDDANRYAVTRSLVRAGFDVTEAANGLDAVRASLAKPDLIILDVRLPDIDGFEVCRRIKQNPQTATIPILHLSASRVTGEDKAFGLNGGAEGYLVRPVEPVELVATINALLRARRSEAALQEREQQFRALIDGVREYAIFALDPAGRITSWPAGAQRMTGYDADEAIGMAFERLFSPDCRTAGEPAAHLREAVETGEFSGESVRMRQDGSTFDAGCSVTATRSAAGELLGFLSLVQDISARKRAEAARELQLASEQAARLEAERVGRMKDEFLATLGHEMRTPLNAILGWSQIMQSGTADADDVKQGIEVIERNARAQAQIIDDLLDMSRIISGKFRLDVKPIDLSAVVQAAIDTLTPAADAKGIRVWTEYEADDGLISGDANRLQQVFWNLLSNAIKFTPSGGDIHIVVRQSDGAFEVRMADTGEGMDPKFLPHVFDRFRQADASTTRRHGGLGIGLSIVKQLVESHGGRIEVASPGAGQGTAFTVTLPVLPAKADHAGDAAEAASDPRAYAVADAATYAAVLDGLRVLVVDDEGDARALMRRLLEAGRASVTMVGSAAAAMDALRSTAFDLLISDIGMPGEDGFALIRQARALPADANGRTPAIALTAYARSEDRDRVLDAGFDAHVAKPVEWGLLVKAVRDVTAGH